MMSTVKLRFNDNIINVITNNELTPFSIGYDRSGFKSFVTVPRDYIPPEDVSRVEHLIQKELNERQNRRRPLKITYLCYRKSTNITEALIPILE